MSDKPPFYVARCLRDEPIQENYSAVIVDTADPVAAEKRMREKYPDAGVLHEFDVLPWEGSNLPKILMRDDL